MKLEGEQILLRIYLRNTDRHGWQLASEAIISRARKEGLAGATLLRGICGLDFNGELLERGRWSLVDHVPVIVEIVDGQQKIIPFLQSVQEIIPEGVVTLERAHVLLYRQTVEGTEKARMRFDVSGRVNDLSTVPSSEDLAIMKLSEDGQLLRIFIGDSDVWNGEPLHRAILYKARELGLAGVTVLHGTMGFGAASRVHTSKLLDISTDLPIVIEIVDSATKIETLLPFLDQSVKEGLITIESVRVLKYRHNKGQHAGP